LLFAGHFLTGKRTRLEILISRPGESLKKTPRPAVVAVGAGTVPVADGMLERPARRFSGTGGMSGLAYPDGKHSFSHQFVSENSESNLVMVRNFVRCDLCAV
jgi:hypothetical protein